MKERSNLPYHATHDARTHSLSSRTVFNCVLLQMSFMSVDAEENEDFHHKKMTPVRKSNVANPN